MLVIDLDENRQRDCSTCAYAQPFGGKYDSRCSAWSCDYINRKEAIEAWKEKYGEGSDE